MRIVVGPCFLIILAVMSCQPISDAPAPNGAIALEGAWKLESSQYVRPDGSLTDGTPNESLVIFSGDHYSISYSYHKEPSSMWEDPWNPTDSEKTERYSSLAVNTGKFELSDSMMVLKPQFALYPAVIDGRVEIIYRVSDDSLQMTYIMQTSQDGVQYPYYAEGNKLVLNLIRSQ